jgi:biopolymer transport protein ExbD
MPIQFRCANCNQLLSISSRKAGTSTVCPSCLEEVQVPLASGEAPPPPPQPADPSAISDPKSPPAIDLPLADSELAPGRQGVAGISERVQSILRREEDDEDDDEEWNPSRKKEFAKDAIDMTAMVDVTFLLLIFFMVTASFAAQKVMETSPPQEEEEESEGGGGAVSVVPSMEDLTDASVIVEVDSHDRITVEGQPVGGLHDLKEILARKLLTEQKTEVLIQAHYDALHGTVVGITDVAIDVGMQKVRRLSRKD